jgi:hypothetical protein
VQARSCGWSRPPRLAQPEVERRERLFREHRRQLGLPLAGEHPTLAALRSVTDDVALGRL